MVKRRLPSQQNPRLDDESTPPHTVLVERRRLGQTDLKASPSSSVGSSKADSLGVFDYAHLRVPLPEDLRKSGIFTPLKSGFYPESYFLMRRSSDGYISATGMYKAAFPWSSLDEEHNERRHHKSLPSGKGEEIAGNVWIGPEDALKLAEEYNITSWILALIDNAPIEVGSKEKSVGAIQSPPRFEMAKDKLLTPPDLTAPTRARSKRSASPAKSLASPRKIASPRKRRAASKQPDESGESTKATSSKSSKAAEKKQENGVVTSSESKDDTVRVEVEEIVEKNKDVETTHTTVSVTLPASHPDLEIPKSTEKVIEKVKEIMVEAHKIEHKAEFAQKPAVKASRKRKASGNITKEEVAEAQPSKKKIKTGLEEKLTTERVRTRALVGLTATLAIGAIIPYFL